MGETHIQAALRLLVVQTVCGLAIGGVLTGVLIASTHLGSSGALFVAAIVVAVAGIAWSLGGPKRALPGTLGIERMDDPVSISQRPVGSSQADAVLVISSVLVGLLLAALAVIAGMVVAVSPAAAGQRAGALPAPSFRSAIGWWTLSTGPTARIAPEVWAASDRGTDQEALFNLFVGLKRLSPRGIVIWASDMGRGGLTTMFTKTRWPLELGGFRLYRSWKGQPAPNVQQRVRAATVSGWHLDVRVYFGTQHPSKATLAKAQAEIDRLTLPMAKG